ncbi:hypothetical protein M5E06_14595 [Azospirillum sp. A1-3]|uniref:hypothetical protein n=1 Tax=Azospirillum sp. A1-3 TaxID=185874 RepID=UPI002076D90F|nr:hypothetical protein [Azospirillum sp. A1-3]MCM8735391.1 hypothetical protein [Azospirillum sp. A1-3]
MASLEQRPNGSAFSSGVWSMMLAAGRTPTVTRLVGYTTKDKGTASKLHFSVAPEVT